MLSVWRPFGVPSASFRTFDREFERLFQEGSRGFEAPAEVLETDEGLVFRVDLPGVADGDLQVTVENNVLTLKAQRRAPEAPSVNRHLGERGYGAVTRTFRLPPWADGGNAQAQLDRGVLTLALPRKAESRPRTIEVKVNRPES